MVSLISIHRRHIIKKNPGMFFGTVQIEYTGNAGFSITGNRKGRRYNFNRKGEVLIVDLQDEAGLLIYPNLQKKTSKSGLHPYFTLFKQLNEFFNGYITVNGTLHYFLSPV